ncbi:MAG: molybdate ABC transporter substrate-binding protein [Vicinamibacterales bacterium]|nr:molybdate ABC transporter substrate-binding protein [Vicinamibacterales bacterium]
MLPDAPQYRFEDVLIDVPNRRVSRAGTPIVLTARYFDALVLLARSQGELVTKDRFFTEVWRDVIVSDAALTQCIKEIRRQLGDEAARPRYVQTVPGYGYRFMASVETLSVGAPDAGPGAAPASDTVPSANTAAPPSQSTSQVFRRSGWQAFLADGAAGTVGGAAAGAFGGVLYGIALAFTPTQAGVGTASILLVLIVLNVVVGAAGAFGVSFGMAAGGALTGSGVARIAGGGLGGLLAGGVATLLGLDVFNLLFGRAPVGMTGGLEGAVLGAALAAGAQLGGGLDRVPAWRPVAGAAAGGMAAGLAIPLAGGNLMGGSLALLARSFAGSRLNLDPLGRFFGEVHFGALTQIGLAGIEGLLFGGGVVGAIVLARRRVGPGVPLVLLALVAGHGCASGAAPPRVAAASDLQFALTEIADRFAQDTGDRVELVFGSSGVLARQIQDGAPFALFLSADEAFVEQLSRAGRTRDEGTLYAIGRIVLFAPPGSPLIPSEGFDGLARLIARDEVARFAIANPDHAPYGRAAEQALRTRALWEALRPRLVLGENVSQAAQFATTGNAVGGIIAYSLALAPAMADRGTHFLIDADDHEPLRQRMVLLENAGPVAEQFYHYLQEPVAREMLARYGFALPE